MDEAVSRLDDLDERDVDEHADVYDTIHGDLADVLDDADSARGRRSRDSPAGMTAAMTRRMTLLP